MVGSVGSLEGINKAVCGRKLLLMTPSTFLNIMAISLLHLAPPIGMILDITAVIKPVQNPAVLARHSFNYLRCETSRIVPTSHTSLL